jgi:hypothetical protein
MRIGDSEANRPGRGGEVRPAPVVLAALLATLAVLTWAPVSAASPEDPCTAGFTCTTSCAIDADGNGATCTVRECAGSSGCAESTTIVPATSSTAPTVCTTTVSTCDLVNTVPTACTISADGFGAVCTLAVLEWRWCALACSPISVGGEMTRVGGIHFTPPQQTPTTPSSPSEPAPMPEPAPAPVGETPAPAPVPPAPPPTAPGQPAPVPPAPAPTQPSGPPPTQPSGNRIVIPFRSGFRLPPGFERREACRGRVRVTLRVGRRVLAVQTVRLNGRCRYAVVFRIGRARLRGARTVTIFAQFRGNAVLGAAGRTYRLRIPGP